MKRFVAGLDRTQSSMFPERLEDWIHDDNPVRVIDVLVDELDLGGLGFGRVEPSDDAGDGGGNSQRVSPGPRATDPNSHTPVSFRLAAVHRTRHLQCKKNHRHRSGYVDNSLPRLPAHTHCATTALSLQNPMVDPSRTL